MKTETSGSNIWSNVVEISNLTQECLPEIECQMSSILSDLDVPISGKPSSNNLDNMELIVLRNGEFKVPQMESTETTRPDLLKNPTIETNSKPDKPKKVKVQDNFEDMLYFVCNLCPFLCTKDTKITEHIQNAHKNKTVTKLLHLKCPACQNIFYHKISLRSHLIHDHGVGNSELGRIIQAVVYFTKNNQATKPNVHNKMESVNNTNGRSVVSCKNEVEVKYMEKIINSEKILHTEEESLNDSNDAGSELVHENENSDDHFRGNEIETNNKVQRAKNSGLPKADAPQDDAEQVFSGILKRQNTLSKYLDQKKLHKCIVPLCKVKMQDINKMNYHIGTHFDNSYKCLECNELFSFWNPLRGHLWRVHKIDMELYSCDKCDYKTFSLGKLNNLHKPIHSDIKAFVCLICEKRFKNAKQLRNHKVTHKEKTLKNVHLCELCNKTFFDKRQLRIHTDGVHNKIKPFLCNYCGYKGSSKSALKMHIRQHTGEKPFTCDSCEYSTADHNSLRRHKLRHSGVKPYKCAHCDYACIQSSTYKVHLKTKHPGLEKDLVFVCHECQFRTVNKDIYLTHLSGVHKQKAFV